MGDFMIGKLYLINKNTNKIVKQINYEELIKDVDFRKKLKNNYLNNSCLKLVCGCNNQIELKIDSLYRIYHKTNDDIFRHSKYCLKHPSHEQYLNINGWNEFDKYISVNLKNNSNTFNSIKLNKFISLLNMYAWNSYINKYSSYPKDKFEFLNRIFGISNKIKLGHLNNKTLNSVFFNVKYFDNLNSNDVRFTYMYLKKFNLNKSKNYVEVIGEYSKGKTFSFIVSRQLFNKQYFLSTSKDSRYNLVFAGFLKKNNEGFEFVDFSIFKVNAIGLYCENEQERYMFDLFCLNKILFIKPYKPIPLYNGYVPNAILITSTKKSIYLEIFDSDSKDKLFIRSLKLNLFNSSLKNTHELIKWDVYNDNKAPSLSYIKKLLI